MRRSRPDSGSLPQRGTLADPSAPGHPVSRTSRRWASCSSAPAYFADHARAGQLSGPGPEAGLARLCWLLAAFKYAYRNDSIDHPLFWPFQHDSPVVAALHAADDDAIADPLALVNRLRASGALEQPRRLAGDPPPGRARGIAAPVISDHRDENTFILNGPEGRRCCSSRP